MIALIVARYQSLVMMKKGLSETPMVARSVTSENKSKLKDLLISYKKNLIEHDLHNMTSTVGVPNVFLEFGGIQINQVLQPCHRLFTFQDVVANVEIWRKSHAVGILTVIEHVLNDIKVDLGMSTFDEEELNIEMDWEEVRDDSSFQSMVDTQDLGWSNTNTSTDSTLVGNRSVFFEDFAMTNTQ